MKSSSLGPIAAGLVVLALGGCADRQTGVPQAAAPAKWTLGYSALAARAMPGTLGKASLRPGEFVWSKTIPATGKTSVVVNLGTQMAYVYRAGALVGAATVSSGKAGRETPAGRFPILQKAKVHHSNRYENAPMPFMQRLNWHGVALHGGTIPGHPASHGCVRLPIKFAQRLFELTAIGSEVVIEDL